MQLAHPPSAPPDTMPLSSLRLLLITGTTVLLLHVLCAGVWCCRPLVGPPALQPGTLDAPAAAEPWGPHPTLAAAEPWGPRPTPAAAEPCPMPYTRC